MDALTGGTLVADSRWGIALGQVDASTLQVIWPAGYMGRDSPAGIELLDEEGVVVGRVGQSVTVAGGMGMGEAWWACGAPDGT